MGGLGPPSGVSPPRVELLEALVAWLNDRMAPADAVIDADTPLFEGLIDSMRILELIAWTEVQIGRKIADEEIRMDHFMTPRRIAERFQAR